jgi:hypothetical protein
LNLSRIIQVILGIAIAATGLYIFFKGVDLHRLVEEIQSIHPLALAGCVVLAILTLYLRSLRWKMMLPRHDKTHTKGLFPNVTIGFMINNIFPARLGEAARVLLLWRQNRFGPAVAVGSIVLERIIDIMVYTSFMFIPIFLLPRLSALRPAGFILAGIFAAGVLVFVIYALKPGVAKRVLLSVPGIMPKRFRKKVRVIIEDIMANGDWLFSPGRIAGVVVLSYLLSALYPLMIILIMYNTTPISLIESLFAQAFAVLGAAIPLAPGYVGTLHAVMLQGFDFLNINMDTARMVAIVYHAVNYIPVTVAGLLFFFHTDISFKDIRRANDEVPDSTEQ